MKLEDRLSIGDFNARRIRFFQHFQLYPEKLLNMQLRKILETSNFWTDSEFRIGLTQNLWPWTGAFYC